MVNMLRLKVPRLPDAPAPPSAMYGGASPSKAEYVFLLKILFWVYNHDIDNVIILSRHCSVLRRVAGRERYHVAHSGFGRARHKTGLVFCRGVHFRLDTASQPLERLIS